MSLRLLVNDKKIWDSFLELLDERIKHNSYQAAVERDDVEVRRAQGRVAELEWLKHLREKVNADDSD